MSAIECRFLERENLGSFRPRGALLFLRIELPRVEAISLETQFEEDVDVVNECVVVVVVIDVVVKVALLELRASKCLGLGTEDERLLSKKNGKPP